MAIGTKRSHYNVNSFNISDYMWINHAQTGDNNINTSGTSFQTTTKPFFNMLDSNGWPNDAALASLAWDISGVRLPASAQFAGPYVITWDGDGQVEMVFGGVTWTEDVSSTNYTKIGNGRWSNTTGLKPRIIVTHSGLTGNLPISVIALATSSTNNLRNFAIYRLDDETDYLAGKLFRAAVKQQYINYNPSAIRFMDWLGVNGGLIHRWEHRALPGQSGFTLGNWLAGVRYSNNTVGTNLMTLAAEASTPASMQHGEVALCRIGAGMARATAFGVAISAITKSALGGVVTTSTVHGFSTGDTVYFNMSSNIPGQAPAGMTQLDCRAYKVVVIDTLNFSLQTRAGAVLDTSGFSTFTIGTVYIYVELQVGSGNDRVAYPVMSGAGIFPVARTNGNVITTGQDRAFVFNKFMIGNADIGAGVWMTPDGNAESPLFSGAPVEYCVAFMNELMAMVPAGKGPIDMWVNIPAMGLVSTDPDYTSGSNYGVNMLTVILNGANGFAGLDSRCNLMVEHSNETWNTGFTSTLFMRRMGYQVYPTGGAFDVSAYSSTRAVQAVTDMKAAFPGNARITYSIGLQGVLGTGVGTNGTRLSGSAAYTAISGDAGAPLSHYDACHFAHYFDNAETNTNSLSSCTTDWVAAGRPTSGSVLDAIVTRAVAGFTTSANGSVQTVSNYQTTLLPAYAAFAVSKSKRMFTYEGGMEYLQTGGTDTIALMAIVRASIAWAQVHRKYFNTFDATVGAEYPSEFLLTGANYGHASPDTYLNGVEGAALDQDYHFLSLRNNSKRRLVVKT